MPKGEAKQELQGMTTIIVIIAAERSGMKEKKCFTLVKEPESCEDPQY